ncbi:Ankyrin repeat-containing domain,Ankyrin repeat [Cinara cedri]|uniref:Ankyrin repeat-containing domain,Ankyrin repeat n=1 Tax=Cinara cedri TaxID=506608 RepID=A0A5E4NK27_9HEMI|nr:Ankyrin repeat-containing domain,Ankyrin repeat [Cinara cedri]
MAAGADANAADNQGKTALYWAAYKGRKEVVKDLLAAGADANAADDQGKTALYWAAQDGHKEVVKDLLAAGADANAADNQGKTALYWAAYKGYKEVVKDLLAAGADANAADNQGVTALHKAAQDGHKEVVKYLLAEGANPLLENRYGQSPTDLAESYEIRKIFEGASELPKMKKEMIGASGMSLLDLVLMNPTDEANMIHCAHNPKLLQEGTYEDRYYIFAAIIGARFEAIEKRRYLENEASNAMIRMCKLNGQELSEDASRILVANIPNIRLKRLIVANINAKDKGQGGKTPLHDAALYGHIDEVNALLKKGAYVNIRDGDGHSPLHQAAANGHTEVVKLLLEQKDTNVNAADKNGYTPLDYASHRGYHVFEGSHQGVIDALLAAGAKKPSTQMDRTQIAQEGASKKV